MSSRASISRCCSSRVSGKDGKPTSDRNVNEPSDPDGKATSGRDVKTTSDRNEKATSDRDAKQASDRQDKSAVSDRDSAIGQDGGTDTASTILGDSYTSDSNEKTQSEATTQELTNQEPTAAAKSADAVRVKGTGKKLSIVRHAERMDRVFRTWTIDTGIDKGSYIATDLNQPLKLPERKSGAMAWLLDPPLTEIGRMTSQMLGRGLKKKLFRCTYIYASPSYRCIETAVEICKGMSQKVPIRVEPGLFEWMYWYRDSEPEWMRKGEMAEFLQGSIDPDYEPMLTASEILSNKTETLADCYERINRVTMSIGKNMTDEESVLIVAHGLNVDAGTRVMRGMSADPPDQKNLVQMGLFYPYLCFVQVEEKTDGTWRIVDDPVPPMSILDVTNRIDPKFYNRA